MELRQHQTEALEAISKNNEGIIHLPTGSGKTLIESYAILNNIEDGFKHFEIPVFVILAPRIILCNQHYGVVKENLLSQNKDCQYLIVHSGRTVDNNKRMWTTDLPFRQLTSTTSPKQITIEYEKAKAEKVPLVIFGTYDSCERIVEAGLPVYMTLCDEAQYLVSEQFNWISRENEENIVKQFNSLRKYYFTATLKETYSDQGLGMNNSDLFGPVIYEKTPLEMITAGEILKPRIHLVNIPDEDISELDGDVNAIIQSFIEHRIHCNVGAKLLVVTKGSEHLNDIVHHPKMQNLLDIRPNLQIFDISSAYHPRINGKEVKREVFLKNLQSLSDVDEAIIFHINILSEGIDVPGITGIMPMNTMGLSKFLQTLGRASRLHGKDREKLYAKILKFSDTDRFIKPYAWIIVPIYGIIGEDLRAFMVDTIYALREHEFNAAEDVVIKESRGKAIPIPIKEANERDTTVRALFDIIITVEHEIEAKVEADKLAVDEFRLDENIKNKTDEQIIDFFSTL